MQGDRFIKRFLVGECACPALKVSHVTVSVGVGMLLSELSPDLFILAWQSRPLAPTRDSAYTTHTHARTILSVAGEDAVVSAEEDGDELHRGVTTGHKETFHERHEPPGVVAAEASVDNVEPALPPVRQQRQPTQPLGIKPFVAGLRIGCWTIHD